MTRSRIMEDMAGEGFSFERVDYDTGKLVCPPDENLGLGQQGKALDWEEAAETRVATAIQEGSLQTISTTSPLLPTNESDTVEAIRQCTLLHQFPRTRTV